MLDRYIGTMRQSALEKALHHKILWKYADIACNDEQHVVEFKLRQYVKGGNADAPI